MAAVDPAVFRPSSGSIALRGNIASGPALPSIKQPPRSADRHTDRASSRFGNLSMNSFFARHNPHPSRVRHIKGLLDIPICCVQDDGYFSNPRYSLQFPPNNFNNEYVKSYSKYLSPQASEPMPVGLSMNPQRHSTNTLTGLNHFLGKSMNMRVFREKAIPRIGMVPVQEAWRDELRALTKAALGGAGDPSGYTSNMRPPVPPKYPPGSAGRVGTAEVRRSTGQIRSAGGAGAAGYSSVTGRLNESAARSRGASRGRGSAGRIATAKTIETMIEDPDTETYVFQLLSQILQTDDPHALKAWLVSAGDREKQSVLDMLRTVLASNPSGEAPDPSGGTGGYQPGDVVGSGDGDRLSVHDTAPPPATPQTPDGTQEQQTQADCHPPTPT